MALQMAAMSQAPRQLLLLLYCTTLVLYLRLSFSNRWTTKASPIILYDREQLLLIKTTVTTTHKQWRSTLATCCFTRHSRIRSPGLMQKSEPNLRHGPPSTIQVIWSSTANHVLRRAINSAKRQYRDSSRHMWTGTRAITTVKSREWLMKCLRLF